MRRARGQTKEAGAGSKHKARRRSIAKPRSRLAGALRKLEAALAQDPRALGARVRAFAARFHAYSPMNRALIFLQRPDATFVKGRKQWEEKDGRSVRRGARAIRILAPALVPGERRAAATRFTEVKVYDVSDTVGPPIAPPPLGLRADASVVVRRLLDLESWVRRSEMELLYQAPAVNSACYGATDGRTIWIHPGLDPAERLAVMAHEIAHVKLHFCKKERGRTLLVDEPEQPPSRDVRELEAELTAFFLLELSGVDSSKGAAAYLTSWKASAAKIRAHAERCFAAACRVLRDCERGIFERREDRPEPV